MRACCDREALLTAFGMVSGVISVRSPKPILQNIQLIANADNRSVLIGTDLDVGIRYHVLGIKVEKPGTVILPTAQISSILRTGTDAEIDYRDRWRSSNRSRLTFRVYSAGRGCKPVSRCSRFCCFKLSCHMLLLT